VWGAEVGGWRRGGKGGGKRRGGIWRGRGRNQKEGGVFALRGRPLFSVMSDEIIIIIIINISNTGNNKIILRNE
jgi:hypothetical protein